MNRNRKNAFQYRQLETRRMLAGDVTVQFTDRMLIIAGDAQDNQVEVNQNAFGNLEVTGLDTTINGGNNAFVTSGMVDAVSFIMNGGDDEATIGSTILYANISFIGGAGDDIFTTEGTYAKHFHMDGNDGQDQFNVDLVTPGSVYVYMGAGDDVLAVESINTGRNFKVFGGSGSDTIASNDVTVRRKMEIVAEDGNDEILFAGNTTVRRSAMIDLGANNDNLVFSPETNNATATLSSVRVESGGGSDNISVDGSTNVKRSAVFRGDAGTDALEMANPSVGSTNSTRGFESAAVADRSAMIDSVFENLNEVGIDATPYGGDVAVPVDFELSLTGGSLDFTENDGATAIDSGAELTGPRNLTVTGATIEIEDFVADDEELLFANANGISGNFDTTTGVLTLSGDASLAAYQSALRSIQYQNQSENPVENTRQIELAVNAGTERVTGTIDLTVSAVNDAPTIRLNSSSATVVDDSLPAQIDNELSVGDAEGNLVSAEVAITAGFIAGQDVLEFEDQAGLTTNYNATTGVLTIEGDVSNDEFEKVLQSVNYNNTSADPTSGTRTLRFTVNDGEATASQSFELTVRSADDPAGDNEFTVQANALANTSVGTVATETSFTGPVVFQFENDDINERLLLNADDHIAGDERAQVIFTEYVDYQCPLCAAYHPVVQQLETEFDGDLAVVRRHLPLTAIHANARRAAVAAESAADQGQFEAYSDLLFDNQDEWENVEDPSVLFEQYARDLGLDIDRFNDGLNAENEERVNRDATEADELSLNSTPTFFLNGNRIANPAFADFSDVIQDAVDALDDPFTINRDTGEIFVADSSFFPADTDEIKVAVIASDASGNSERVEVSIRITR